MEWRAGGDGNSTGEEIFLVDFSVMERLFLCSNIGPL